MRTTAAIAMAILVGAGCGTPGGPRRHEVSVTSAGVCLLHGRAVSADALPAALKAAGARPDDRVQVSMAADSTVTMPTLARKLAESGFRRVYFVRPRKASAYVNTGRRTATTTPTRRP